MVKRSFLLQRTQKDPLVLWEEAALSYGWSYRRVSSAELVALIENMAHPLELVIRWYSAKNYLEILGKFEIEILEKDRLPVLEILSVLSQEIQLGGFHLCLEDRKPMFKYATFLSSAELAGVSYFWTLIDDLLCSGNQLIEALQYLIKEGHSASEAMFAAFLEIGGEA